MRALLSKRMWAWLATMLAVLGLCLVTAGSASADPGNSGDASCTTGSLSSANGGGSGEWYKTYNPNCADNTKATVDITWDTTVDGNGHRHFLWDAVLSTGPIYGDKCVEVALDMFNPTGGHEDIQYLRNCKENSSALLNNGQQNIDVYTPNFNFIWWANNLQMGVYNTNDCTPNTCAVTNKVCPGASGAPPGTDGDTECTNWLDNAGRDGSTGAKIYRHGDTGANLQNSPTWPGNYHRAELVDADS